MIETLLFLSMLAASTPSKPAVRAKAPVPKPAATATPAAPARLTEAVADSLLLESDALRWVGGPLGGTYTYDEPAVSQNGHDHATVRGWYPEGWHPATADAPPVRGMHVSVHAFADTTTAREFADHAFGRDRASVGNPEGPFANFTIATVDGMGDRAHLKTGFMPGKGGIDVSIATLSLLRGRTFLQLQVWMADGSAAAVAKEAGGQMVTRLP